ncbi:MAG: terminase [Magnetococcales bacterium]|nr:terminase [Magnetococcales bacterium]
MSTVSTGDIELARAVGEFYHDPLGFVLFAFPWGKGELKGHAGPRTWQREYLEQLGAEVKRRNFNGSDPVEPVQMATASGHGIGKSALTAFLILWILSTRPHAKGVVTANTADQLRTKTWGELGKWLKLCITGHWFDYSSGKNSMSLAYKGHHESWRVDAQTCREENSESFAGQHAQNSSSFYIFDEASAVPDVIYQVARGGLTDGEPLWFLFGNPTRNSGEFREAFGKNRHRWVTRQIDSRTVEGTNKDLLDEWEKDWGTDSDFFRVRVRGMFPSASSAQFIASDAVARCIKLTIDDDDVTHMPLVFGLDVARFGVDRSCLVVRRGRKVLKVIVFKEKRELMQLSTVVSQWINGMNPLAVFIDGTGLGAGVVDRLRQLGHRQIIDVQGAAKASKPIWGNLRAEMWAKMKDAIHDGLDLPDDPRELQDDLIGPEFFHNQRDALMIEPKEAMKRRGLASPDTADALALTYAQDVATRMDYSSLTLEPEEMASY